MRGTVSLLIVFLMSVSPEASDAPASETASMRREILDSATENQSRLGLKIVVSVDGRPLAKPPRAYPRAGQDIALALAGGAAETIRWYLIFPDLTQYYQNANPPWEANPYKWVGFDTIQYYRVELSEFRGLRQIRPFQKGIEMWPPVRTWLASKGSSRYALDFYKERKGTFWFQVEATRGGVHYRSPGISERTERGLSSRVTRVSIRDGDGFLGFLSSYYNVPGLFGSVLYQSRHHLGVDCADVLMAAWATWRRTTLEKNYNVQMMTRKFKRLQETRVDGGEPRVPIRWHETVRPGDFIAVSYGGKRFHHVGALLEDANQNGLLDAEDLVIHAGPEPLHVSPLGTGVFDGRVRLLKY